MREKARTAMDCARDLADGAPVRFAKMSAGASTAVRRQGAHIYVPVGPVFALDEGDRAAWVRVVVFEVAAAAGGEGA